MVRFSLTVEIFPGRAQPTREQQHPHHEREPDGSPRATSRQEPVYHFRPRGTYITPEQFLMRALWKFVLHNRWNSRALCREMVFFCIPVKFCSNPAKQIIWFFCRNPLQFSFQRGNDDVKDYARFENWKIVLLYRSFKSEFQAGISFNQNNSAQPKADLIKRQQFM